MPGFTGRGVAPAVMSRIRAKRPEMARDEPPRGAAKSGLAPCQGGVVRPVVGIAVGISVAAVLVGLYLAWPKATAVGDAAVPIEAAAAAVAPAAVAPAAAASDAQAYRDSLLARGLSLDETK